MRYNLRPNRKKNYSNRLDYIIDNLASIKSYDMELLQTVLYELTQTGCAKNTMKIIAYFIFIQMTVRAGIRKHGELAVNILCNEVFQLDNIMVFLAMHASELTKEQKNNALRAINLIKEKRCRKLKGRTVADGSK